MPASRFLPALAWKGWDPDAYRRDFIVRSFVKRRMRELRKQLDSARGESGD